MQHSCPMLLALSLTLIAISSALLYDEEYKTVCLGNEFSLPVFSKSRSVIFTPKSPPGQKRTILEKTLVKDPRFEWTSDRRLVLKEVTWSDEGQYTIMLHSDFAYEMIQLTVSECVRSYQVNYGNDFQHRIPEGGNVLEFNPLGSPPEAEPVLLWNGTDPGMSPGQGGGGGRGQMLRNGELWVARKVSPADQGNYTLRNKAGKLMSRSKLTVRGHSFTVTRLTRESVSLLLFVAVHNASLTFTPWAPDDGEPRSRGSPVRLIRDGRVLDTDVRFLHRVSVEEAAYGSPPEVVITGLSVKHAGVYDVRDGDGNLVSSTVLHDYSPDVNQPSGSYSHPQRPGTPRKWSPKASPAHTGYTPVAVGNPSFPGNSTAGNRGRPALPDHTPAHPAPTTIGDSFVSEQNSSVSVPGASDCLHTSEDCVQFQIKTKGKRTKVTADFCTLPLESEAREDSTIYTSDKLNFL
ncbi:hypothetical protein CRUP_009853 [Coryphaenoides rupestris]|nr:hypothetical protein CRUP_009853 [Coryphaenoides rupestris]